MLPYDDMFTIKLIPIEDGYKNVPFQEPVLFYDNNNDNYFVGVVTGFHAFMNEEAERRLVNPKVVRWCMANGMSPDKQRTGWENFYLKPTHWCELPARPLTAICSDCGRAVSIHQRFCDKCGKRFDQFRKDEAHGRT